MRSLYYVMAGMAIGVVATFVIGPLATVVFGAVAYGAWLFFKKRRRK